MYEFITEKTIPEYEAFVQSHPKGNFAQSYLWGKQKPMWKWDAVAVRGADGKLKGTLALMTRKVPGIGRSLMYGCRGPVCDLDDRETFAQLLDGAKALAKKYKAYVIKIDPDVPSSNTAFSGMLQSFGFRGKEGGKNFEAIQPRYVFRLNVEGKTEEELLAGFHQKWRYNIRLAQRKGVSVRICGKEMVPAFSELMLTTGVRDGFVTRQPEYFANMLDNLGEHARLYMAFDPEGTPIAGTLAIHYGDKVWYLYGASSNEHRNLMPNYLLQWSMIQWAVGAVLDAPIFPRRLRRRVGGQSALRPVPLQAGLRRRFHGICRRNGSGARSVRLLVRRARHLRIQGAAPPPLSDQKPRQIKTQKGAGSHEGLYRGKRGAAQKSG